MRDALLLSNKVGKQQGISHTSSLALSGTKLLGGHSHGGCARL